MAGKQLLQSHLASDPSKRAMAANIQDLNKRMEQTQQEAFGIERELRNAQTHLRRVRQGICADKTGPPCRGNLRVAFAEMDKVKQKMDVVEEELQLGWMTLSRMQAEFSCRQQQDEAEAALRAQEEELGKKSMALQQLSGSYKDLKHSLHNANSLQQDVARAKKLYVQVHNWCESTRIKADQQFTALKQLRTDFASNAHRLLQPPQADKPQHSDSFLNQGLNGLVLELKQEQHDPKSKPINKAACDRKLSEGDRWELEKEFLLQKKAFLNSLQQSFQRVRQRELACINVEKRLLGARLSLQQAQKGCVSSDYLSSRCKQQMEQAYSDLLHVQHDIDTILLHHEDEEPAADFVAAASEELIKVKSELWRQTEINMKLKQELAKYFFQAELLAAERLESDKQRKQQAPAGGGTAAAAAGSGGGGAGASGGGGAGAGSGGGGAGSGGGAGAAGGGGGGAGTAAAAAAAGDKNHNTVEETKNLKEQLEQHKMRDSALQDRLETELQKNMELSLENDTLSAKLGGQNMDMVRLKRENVCLVVEKVSFEGSARSLQEKMSNLLSKLSEAKQRWKTGSVVELEAM